MHRRFAAGILAVALAFVPGRTAPRDFAIGVTVGSPMGLSFLQNIDSASAIQGALEWGVYHTFVAHADYLFKIGSLFPIDPQYGKLLLNYGPGARLEIGDRDLSLFGPYRHSENARVALRFPVGLQYYIPRVPFDVFVEVAPMLALWHATNLDLTAAFGLRFDL